MGQLAEGLENNMFNPNDDLAFNLDIPDDDVVEVRRRGGRQAINTQSFNSQSSVEMVAQRNLGNAEDRELLNQIRQAERRPARGGRRGIIRARNVRNIMHPTRTNNSLRINPNFDPDNSLYDRDSDENFEIPEAQSNFEDDDNAI